MTTKTNAPTKAAWTNGKGEGGTNKTRASVHSHGSNPRPTAPNAAPLDLVLSRLHGVKKHGDHYTARCPGPAHQHGDRRPSLSIGEGRGGRALLKCHAGCDVESIVAAINLTMADLMPPGDGNMRRDACIPPETRATAQHSSSEPAAAEETSLTLEEYAAAKCLPVRFLESLGLSTQRIKGRTCVRIPYRHPDGTEAATRYRLALSGENRFRWKSGSKTCLYGLDRLDAARAAGYVVIVEGESDCHTLWRHGIPAVGLPGAANWNDARDAAHLDGIGTIHIACEPDTGGEAVRRWLSGSSIKDRARLVDLSAATGHKDPSALHTADPDAFAAAWEAAVAAAVRFTELEAQSEAATRAEAWEVCKELAALPDIPAAFIEALHRTGVVGEERAARLVYLALTSRFLARPVSLAIKGASSSGKSHTTEKTLAFFPRSAYLDITASSERYLAYTEEPLSHRFLVIFEAAGIQGDAGTYLIRSLLSEGRVKYATVEKTANGMRPRLVEMEGPTGLITTTTAVRLHPENETRFFSVPTDDSRSQTRAVFRALASEETEAVDLTPWHALQTWLALSEHRVSIPFAGTLADLVADTATRLRRDFGAILNLIRANAILHQHTRERTPDGRILATLEDYAAVWKLVADLVSDAAEAAVPPDVRETVEAVKRLASEAPTLGNEPAHVTITALAAALELDKSAASRRVRKAGDYITNLEERKGKPARLVTGEPLPSDVETMPTPARLAEAVGGCCTVAPVSEGIDSPSLTSNGTRRERRVI